MIPYLDRMTLTTILVSVLIYVLFFLGLSLLFAGHWKALHSRWLMRKRLLARSRGRRQETRLENHLRCLMVPLKKSMEPGTFLFCESSLFLIIVIVGMRTVSAVQAVWIGVLIAAMPYLLLRVKLESTRRRGSHEGERLIAEFLTQYRICGCNIYRGMEQVVLSTKEMKISSQLLFKLLLELRNTGDPKEIKLATERFSYGIHTNWGRILANNIRIAAEKGMDITLALEDLLIQMRDARLLAEERKRLNAESARMVIFLIPMMYLGTVLLSLHYLDLSLHRFLRNQFYTEQGFLLFLFIVFTFLANLMIIEMVSNQRFDY